MLSFNNIFVEYGAGKGHLSHEIACGLNPSIKLYQE